MENREAPLAMGPDAGVVVTAKIRDNSVCSSQGR